MKIAIMQPYFVPYAGYFRLFHATDLFVLYDCVQFTRRGYVHRNQLLNAKGEPQWLTLPLEKSPQDIAIDSLSFTQDAEMRMREQMNRFPLFKNKNYMESEFKDKMMDFTNSPVDYIANLLKITSELLHIPFNVLRSSELNIPSELKGQDRILFLARQLKAKEYINAPGGKSLYDPIQFQERNIKLTFLTSYEGPNQSILQRLFSEDINTLRKEITSQCQ